MPFIEGEAHSMTFSNIDPNDVSPTAMDDCAYLRVWTNHENSGLWVTTPCTGTTVTGLWSICEAYELP